MASFMPQHMVKKLSRKQLIDMNLQLQTECGELMYHHGPYVANSRFRASLANHNRKMGGRKVKMTPISYDSDEAIRKKMIYRRKYVKKFVGMLANLILQREHVMVEVMEQLNEHMHVPISEYLQDEELSSDEGGDYQEGESTEVMETEDDVKPEYDELRKIVAQQSTHDV